MLTNKRSAKVSVKHLKICEPHYFKFDGMAMIAGLVLLDSECVYITRGVITPLP